MCIRDRHRVGHGVATQVLVREGDVPGLEEFEVGDGRCVAAVSYTHLRAHETVLDLVCRLLLEKKKH